MKIVKFKNGMFAIRKGIFVYKYLDLSEFRGSGIFNLSKLIFIPKDNQTKWRKLNDVYIGNCFEKDLKIVKKIFDETTKKDYGSPISNEDMVVETL